MIHNWKQGYLGALLPGYGQGLMVAKTILSTAHLGSLQKLDYRKQIELLLDASVRIIFPASGKPGCTLHDVRISARW